MSTTTRPRSGSCQSRHGRCWAQDPVGHPDAAVPQHAAGADHEVDLAQVDAGALDDPALGADHDLRPAGVPAHGQGDRGAGDGLVLVVLPVGGRGGNRGRRAASWRPPRGPAAPPRRRSRPRTSACPRSPSTVRVTGVGATTSRASSAVSGSSSTTECTSVVAPPTSTTTTSPVAVASSSTPVRTTSGVAPRTMAVKSRALAQVLAADDVGQEDLADRGARAGRREDADLRDHVVREHVRDPLEDGADLVAGVDVAGHDDRAAPAAVTRPRAARRIGSRLPPSVPPVSRTTSGASAVRSRSCPWATARTVTTLPPLDRATRRPASAVTSSSLPTTAIRSPPPALEQASTSAAVALGSTLGQLGQAHVVPVEDVGVDGGAVLGAGKDHARRRGRRGAPW